MSEEFREIGQQEQTPEEIKEILINIVDRNKEIENDYEKIRVILTVLNPNNSPTENEVAPLSIDETHLELFDGEFVFSVELIRIKKLFH